MFDCLEEVHKEVERCHSKEGLRCNILSYRKLWLYFVINSYTVVEIRRMVYSKLRSSNTESRSFWSCIFLFAAMRRLKLCCGWLWTYLFVFDFSFCSKIKCLASRTAWLSDSAALSSNATVT